MSLKRSLIRLAHQKPETRKHLVPLLRTANTLEKFLEQEGDALVRHPDTGNQVKIKSLKGDRGQKLLDVDEYKDWRALGRGVAKALKNKKELDEDTKTRILHLSTNCGASRHRPTPRRGSLENHGERRNQPYHAKGLLTENGQERDGSLGRWAGSGRRWWAHLRQQEKDRRGV